MTKPELNGVRLHTECVTRHEGSTAQVVPSSRSRGPSRVTSPVVALDWALLGRGWSGAGCPRGASSSSRDESSDRRSQQRALCGRVCVWPHLGPRGALSLPPPGAQRGLAEERPLPALGCPPLRIYSSPLAGGQGSRGLSVGTDGRTNGREAGVISLSVPRFVSWGRRRVRPLILPSIRRESPPVGGRSGEGRQNGRTKARFPAVPVWAAGGAAFSQMTGWSEGLVSPLGAAVAGR